MRISNSSSAWMSALQPIAKTLELMVQVTPFFVFFVLLHWWLMHVARLPEASYHRASIAWEVGRQIGVLPLIVLIAVSLVLWNLGTLGGAWSQLEHGNQWRPLILLIVSILTWTYATYDYNLYFNKAHIWDRLLLIGLATAVIWRPFFLLPLSLLLTAIIWQFTYPIDGYSVTEQYVLVRILLLVFVALAMQSVPMARIRRHGNSATFAFLLLTLVASSYWWPGLGKLRLGWFNVRHIHFLLPAAYSSGWLRFLSSDQIAQWTSRLASIDWLLVLFTLVAECGAILFLWRRRIAVMLALSWGVMHLGIVIVSGIFFWKWIFVDLALALFLWRDAQRNLFPLFKPEHLLLSIFLIGGGHYWYNAANFAWYDTPLNYAYRIEATGQSGKTYQLPSRFFAPYDYQFSLGSFGYLVDEKRLNIIYGGAWQPEIVTALNTSHSTETLFAIEQQYGMNGFDTDRSQRFDDFMIRFMGNLNAQGGKFTALHFIQPPSHLLSFPYFSYFDGNEPITRIEVYQVTSFFDGEHYREVRDQLVRRTEITGNDDLSKETSR